MLTRRRHSPGFPTCIAIAFNSVRLMWRVDAARSETDDSLKQSLTNTKANGKHQLDRAFSMRVDSDSDDNPITISWLPEDPRTMIEFLSKMTWRDRIVAVLREERRAMHVLDIVAALKAHGIVWNEKAALALLDRHHVNKKRRGVAFADSTDAAGMRVWLVATQEGVEVRQ